MPTETAIAFPTLESSRSDLPTISGWESEIQALMQGRDRTFHPTNLSLENITAGFACALHMHQPTIPAGTNGALICNLQYMFEHPNEGVL